MYDMVGLYSRHQRDSSVLSSEHGLFRTAWEHYVRFGTGLDVAVTF